MDDAIDILRAHDAGRFTTFFASDAGRQEVLLDRPPGPLRGMAIITHPQPLLGGNAHHKVPYHLATAASEAGWLTLRPQFRGVGHSDGTYDQGVGETLDVLRLVDAMRQALPDLPLALVGFSFGAFVQAHASAELQARGAPAQRVFLASLPVGLVDGERFYDTPTVPDDAFLVHGERDTVVPLQAVLDYARPLTLPVMVLPDAGHLLGSYLPRVREMLKAQLTSVSS